ncbi:MAG: hypothetical protein JXL85_10115 [Bacilli bacterium]|nr:hypothetical protein [Bacilli bacterium]
MKKKLIAVLLVAIMLSGSAFAYSWWDNLTQTEAQTVNIGEGVTLTVSAVAEAPSGKYLVPAGVVLKANDVEEIQLTYNVKLDQAALSALNLDVQASNVLIGGESTNASLVNIDISQASSTVNDSNVLVTITVTLSQPDTLEIYNTIKNQTITFDLTFTATQA